CVGSSPRVSGACQDDTREFAIRRPRFVERLSGVVEKLTGSALQANHVSDGTYDTLRTARCRQASKGGSRSQAQPLAARRPQGQPIVRRPQGAAARDQPRGDDVDHKVGRPLVGLLLAGKGSRRLRWGRCDDVMRVREEG
ncbi:hypothetical protein GW17_00059377, partial [Ensete ventricosum]